MPPCTDAKLHWLHLYAFSNVSSNCLPEQMQSRIGCTPIAQMADIGFKVVLLERLNQKWKQKHF